MVDTPQARCTPGLTDGHSDGRLVAPAASRNEQPLIDALMPLLHERVGKVLEIGSGTGQHCAAFARAFSELDWQPSDPFDEHLDSIRAWVAHAARPNLCPPVWLDAAEDWPAMTPLTAVFSANVIHITPWVVAKGIVRGACKALAQDGMLMFYGPFKEDGAHTGAGNAAFDARLQAEDPTWGIRDIGEITQLTQAAGLSGPEITQMPANNRLICYRKA